MSVQRVRIVTRGEQMIADIFGTVFGLVALAVMLAANVLLLAARGIVWAVARWREYRARQVEQ